MAFDFPNAPTTNQLVTMADGTVRRWDGAKWVAGQTPTGPYCFIGDSPPTSPIPGTTWWCSADAQLYLYYNDGNSSQWVPAVAVPASIGEAPSNSNIYGRQNGQWTNLSASQLQGNVGRNLIHNSMFNVNQRGTGPWATGGYTTDRWIQSFTNGTLSGSIISLSDADRTAIGDEAAKFSYQFVATGGSAAADFTGIFQALEDVRRLANKIITISLWARATSGTPKIGINLYQNFGTGGSPSTGVWANAQSVTLSTTWTRYSVTISIPSIAGKTLGTNNNDNLALWFWFSTGTNQNANAGNIGVQSGTFQLWGIQVEIGSVATQLEKIDYQDDLKHCQRFYAVGRAYYTGYGAAAITVSAPNFLPVSMRATPSIVITNQASNNITSPSIGALSGSASTLLTTGTATASGGVIVDMSYTASADL